MNIPTKGIEINNGDRFSIGNYVVTFTYAERLNEIE